MCFLIEIKLKDLHTTFFFILSLHSVHYHVIRYAIQLIQNGVSIKKFGVQINTLKLIEVCVYVF
jgi:hypothetical protein